MIKYFVDPDGIYLGGFDGVEPPVGVVEVPVPPDHGLQRRVGGVWVDTPDLIALRQREAETVTLVELIDALKARGVVSAADLDAVRGTKL